MQNLPKIHPKLFAHHLMNMKHGIISKLMLNTLEKQLIYLLGKSIQKSQRKRYDSFV